MKYTILAVDPAGTPWDVCQTDHRDSAHSILAGLRGLKDGRLYWSELTDDPERGEVDLDEEED